MYLCWLKKSTVNWMSWLDFVTLFVPLPKSYSWIMLSFCPTFNTALRCGIFVVLETEKLESLNKRALHIVFNDKVSSYQQLQHNSGGATLYNRRIQNMLITIYKCLNHESFPKHLRDMLTLRQSVYSSRRTNMLSLCKPATYGLNYFRYFASKKWNSLLDNVRSEPNFSGLEDS